MAAFKFMNGEGFNAQGQAHGIDGSPLRSLPNIAPSGQATYAKPAGDPISTFNLRLLEMLQKAQGGQTNAPLYNRSNELQNTMVENSMAPASELGLDGLRPGDALNARRNQGSLYDPEVKSINDRISLNNEAIDKFERALKTAKEYGEEYAKTIKPDEATINAVKEQMAAGFLPSASVIEKLGKYLIPDDWNALAEGKKKEDKPSGETLNLGGNYYRITRDSDGKEIGRELVGPAGDPEKPSEGDKKGEKLTTILNSAKSLPRGSNNYASPLDYLDKASDYIAAGGSVNEFIAAVIPSRQLSPSDAEYVRQELNRAEPSSGPATKPNPWSKG